MSSDNDSRPFSSSAELMDRTIETIPGWRARCTPAKRAAIGTAVGTDPSTRQPCGCPTTLLKSCCSNSRSCSMRWALGSIGSSSGVKPPNEHPQITIAQPNSFSSARKHWTTQAARCDKPARSSQRACVCPAPPGRKTTPTGSCCAVSSSGVFGDRDGREFG